jgi:hypothetical protein
MDDNTLINRVFSDPDFPERQKINKNSAYVLDNRVCWDFTSSANEKMRYCCYFGKYNLDEWFIKNNKPVRGEFENLIIRTEFI